MQKTLIMQVMLRVSDNLHAMSTRGFLHLVPVLVVDPVHI